MTRKRIGLIGFVSLATLIGVLTVQIFRVTTSPAFSMPGLWPSPPPTALDSGTKTISDFRLKDIDGRDVSLADFKDKKAIAVVFIGTECPLVNLYVVRLAEMQRELGPLGLQILGINSNSQDSPTDVAKHAHARKLPFPVLLDRGQKVADLFGAERTPEAFLLEPSGLVRYCGRIDDQYGAGSDRRAPTRHDLKEAIREVLAGKPVSVATTTPVPGCFIGRGPVPSSATGVTFTRDIAPILQRHCQECHRPEQVAPFSLLTYEQASGWSETIAEVVSDGRMPPWNADPRHGEFANDRRLPEPDRKLLLAWVKQGCPKGDDKDAPAARVFPKDWAIGNPNVVLKMNEAFTIPAIAPAKGIEYQHFVLPTHFDEDVWVQAVEARPGNRAVVHHMIVYIGDKPMGEEEAGDRDVLTAYVPGSKPAIYPSGLAKRIPKGAKLVLEMHYTANGTQQTDQSSIALIFAKAPPKHEVRTRFLANRKFAIPPRADRHEVTAVTTFDKDALILSLSPHMHLRGKSFLFRAVYPDKRTEILLSVPRYDFNWQHSYALKKPLFAPAGTKIECVGVFDNSAANRNNPDPTQEVRWGDQSWEEMMLGVVGYIDVNEPSRKNGAMR